MCSSCQKWKRDFERGQVVIKRVRCTCKCLSTELGTETRCLECDCKLPVIIVGVNDQEEWDDAWRDGEGNVIRRDEILHT